MDTRMAISALLVCTLGALATLVVLPLVKYVVSACLLAALLRPANERLVPRVGTRVAAITLTGVTVVAGIVPLVLVSVVVLRTTVSTLEAVDGTRTATYSRKVAQSTLGLNDETVVALEAAVQSELDGAFSSVAEVTLSRTIDLVTLGVDLVVGSIVFLFALYYLLRDGPAVVNWFRDVSPLDPRVFDELFAEVADVTRAVLRSHVLVALVQGVLGGLGLAILGVSYATTLGVVLVLVSVLPTIGIWLVWGPVTIAHAASSGLVRGAVVLGYGLVVLPVTDYYLRAFLVDRGTDLHPAVALLGGIGGLNLFGIVGLFVGPVVLASFKAVVTIVSRLGRHSSRPGLADIERDRQLAEQSR
ncbi:AI-2E family transporter [Natrinema gelatinilyticum]|uniref:AI-2E family transporter n=1 Tax=Natrinema gelatinilyticum TaxID=2961571 RepID=UPI0020C53328|nr:AI-2E family transporter [Natrinema gelatinilyticum]